MDDPSPADASPAAQATAACVRALALAVRLLDAAGTDLGGRRLAGIDHLAAEAGADAWRLTFLPPRPPADGGDVPPVFGGELFVQVDARRGEIVSVTYGE